MSNTHNAIRGRSNVWERAIRTIEALAPLQKQLRLRLQVNQTIVNAEGLKDYGRLGDYLKPLKINNNIVFGYIESATYRREGRISIEHASAGQFNSYGQFNNAQLRSFFFEVKKDLTQYLPLTRLAKQYYIKGIRNRLLHRTGFPNPKCVALSSHLRLIPDGSLPTCQFNSISIGNLRRHDFASIWFGEAIADQRQWINECPGCWRNVKFYRMRSTPAILPACFVIPAMQIRRLDFQPKISPTSGSSVRI